jgi:RecA-family ATPase
MKAQSYLTPLLHPLPPQPHLSNGKEASIAPADLEYILKHPTDNFEIVRYLTCKGLSDAKITEIIVNKWNPAVQYYDTTKHGEEYIRKEIAWVISKVAPFCFPDAPLPTGVRTTVSGDPVTTGRENTPSDTMNLFNAMQNVTVKTERSSEMQDTAGLYFPDELPESTENDWLVPGIFERGDTSYLNAAYGVGKTFEGLEEALAICLQLPFPHTEDDSIETEIPPNENALVLYIAGEGKMPGYRKRLDAIIKSQGKTLEDLRGRLIIMDRAYSMDTSAGQLGMAKTLAAVKAKFGAWPDVIYADTLSRHMSKDENSNEAAGTVRDAVDAVKRETGCAWRWCHHVGKGGDLDGRGASDFGDSADSITSLEKKHGLILLKVRKLKDEESGREIWYKTDKRDGSLVHLAVPAPAQAQVETTANKVVTEIVKWAESNKGKEIYLSELAEDIEKADNEIKITAKTVQDYIRRIKDYRSHGIDIFKCPDSKRSRSKVRALNDDE